MLSILITALHSFAGPTMMGFQRSVRLHCLLQRRLHVLADAKAKEAEAALVRARDSKTGIDPALR